ncbi:MAG TPA: methyltransferase domain-containing protein [Candidatus Acidoferrales bacterium]|nr:methyltransferase domain-containing protein [Candidatus Acidoferrales bacterium]
MATLVGTLHGTLVHTRRVRILADRLAAMVPPGARVLDVGCGDGALDRLIMELRPDVNIEGIDVLVRPNPKIHVKHFDGTEIPYPDASFDAVMFVDVLHHTANPAVLLREAKRVGRIVLIKDHCKEGFLAHPTLQIMDWVGNAHHGVSLPYNYWSRAQWTAAFKKLDLKVTAINERLGLYPAPVSWVLERGLHFAARIDRADAA